MEQIYVIMLIALAILAIIDLMVGVSNDAVNFLNSAIGSKAVSFKTIMIVASAGVAIGALYSNGMMEVARSGIFTPSMFSFNDVIFIFLAVMITDVLLLDVFNTLGLPTSTTVSVIFSLLGAAVFLAVSKIFENGEEISSLGAYINSKKASEIVYSILLSVLLSFVLGAIIQYVSRLMFTFHVEKRYRLFGALFGGFALTAITFFILIKGLKSVTFISKDSKSFIKDNQILILGGCFLFWSIFSQIFISFKKYNIFKLIIIFGTFGLALAFAGNDLVNFIGVPIAAFQSYEMFSETGQLLSGKEFMMSGLEGENLPAPFVFLALSGLVMIYTLWTSKKARNVIETEQNLSRQGEGNEKYEANFLSRYIVRGAVYISKGVDFVVPNFVKSKVNNQFVLPAYVGKRSEQPMFDMVRASVNLIVAAVLISIGTSMKLPLSTTYVTFMVAMGTSFADRAWDRESAVYRIAGVFNVIGGWFFTAFAAFIMSGIIVYILYIGEVFAFFGFMIIVALFFYKSHLSQKRKIKESENIKQLNNEDVLTIHEIFNECSSQISKIIEKTNKIYSQIIAGLSIHDLQSLKENRKVVKKHEKQVDELKNNVYYFIKNLEETSVEASKFYILTLGFLQDIVQSMSYISNESYSHVSNNHKPLKFNQLRDLKSIELEMIALLKDIESVFSDKKFDDIDKILVERGQVLNTISDLIQKQITRIRTSENSPKNSKLYFGLLLETNDLVKATMSLLELFKEFREYAKNK